MSKTKKIMKKYNGTSKVSNYLPSFFMILVIKLPKQSLHSTSKHIFLDLMNKESTYYFLFV